MRILYRALSSYLYINGGSMKKNVGTVDKYVRIFLGLAIFVIGYIYETWWGLIGFLPLLTGLLNTCGLYSLLGLSTCKSVESTK